MIATSAGGAFITFLFAVYVIGIFVAVGVYTLNQFRSSRFSFRALRGRRQTRAKLTYGLKWPATLYRFARSMNQSRDTSPAVRSSTEQTKATPPPSDDGRKPEVIEIPKYGLIDEADS